MIPGPQQPFLQAAAVLTPIVMGLLGTSESARERQHDETLAALEKNRKDPRIGEDRLTDLTGSEIDFDASGRARTVVVQSVNVKVDAMDSKSFLDRAPDISRAVSQELNSGNNDLRTAVQEASFS